VTKKKKENFKIIKLPNSLKINVFPYLFVGSNARKMPKSFRFFTVEKGLSSDSDPSGILGQQHFACWPCDSALNSGRVLKRDPCRIHKSLNGDCPCV